MLMADQWCKPWRDTTPRRKLLRKYSEPLATDAESKRARRYRARRRRLLAITKRSRKIN